MANQADDLDQLFDSALDDFQNLNLISSQRSGDGEGKKPCGISSSGEVQGLVMGLPDLRSKKKGKQKVSKDSHVSEAIDQLRAQTKEAVKGLESVMGGARDPVIDDFSKDPMMEDWVKQFEDLAGSQDMESIVETMMHQLLSKEILNEPMKEIGERYPKWLEDNKSKLSKEEFDRYSTQYELIKDLNIVYETEPDNFNKIVELMQKMQECGQPPNDIVRELAPDLDLSNMGQLSPEMLEGQQNCCVM